jgi:hypothetical protein
LRRRLRNRLHGSALLLRLLDPLPELLLGSLRNRLLCALPHFARCSLRVGLSDDRLLPHELRRRLAELLLCGRFNRRLGLGLELSRGLRLPALLRRGLTEGLALLRLALRFRLKPFRLGLGALLRQGLRALLCLRFGLSLRFRLQLSLGLLLTLAPRPGHWSRGWSFLLRGSLDGSLLTRLRLGLSRLGHGLSLRLRAGGRPCLGRLSRLCLGRLCLGRLRLGSLRFLPRLATLLGLELPRLRFRLGLLLHLGLRLPLGFRLRRERFGLGLALSFDLGLAVLLRFELPRLLRLCLRLTLRLNLRLARLGLGLALRFRLGLEGFSLRLALRLLLGLASLFPRLSLGLLRGRSGLRLPLGCGLRLALRLFLRLPLRFCQNRLLPRLLGGLVLRARFPGGYGGRRHPALRIAPVLRRVAICTAPIAVAS